MEEIKLKLTKLSRNFYVIDTLNVAKDLIGKYLIHKKDDVELIGKIVEVEAYKGAEDKAAHSYGNKLTPRTEAMFGPPGHAYVYLIYGMYYCMNIVCEAEGIPNAVLIRALEPIKGQDIMSKNRYSQEYDKLDKRKKINMTNGPGKLCDAMEITINYNKEDLCGSKLYIAHNENYTIQENDIGTSPRINIDYAEEAIHFPWRFFLKGNPYVLKKKFNI